MRRAWCRKALAAGYPTLIAGGGDGTLREVAEALALAGSQASLALLPLGTANDFCRAAGIRCYPLRRAGAAGMRAAPDRPSARVDGQLFLNMATGGFGSRVTANTPEELRNCWVVPPIPRPG